MNEARTEIDPDRLDAYARRMLETVTAGFACVIGALGDDLGLYRALHELRAATSVELAAHTGLDERWLREWLRHQACVQQIDYEAASDRFRLSPEAVAVLLDDTSEAYFGGGFASVASTLPALGRLAQSFHDGLGLTYDEHGAGCACTLERLSQRMHRFELVPRVLPQLDGMIERLERGARVADVGCGAALSTIAMAQAFPNSRFTGYDVSEHALARARENVRHAGIDNLTLANPETEPLPQAPTFDLITTFDVIHDVPFPDRLIAAIHGALVADGCWLCEDIRSFPDFERNRTDHPAAGLLYGFSLMVCLSAGLSQAGGAGLGTLGFSEAVARRMAAAAGFGRFRKLAYDSALNCFYDIRR